MNKRFDCIRIYRDNIKRATESKQPHNNIEFVLSDKSRLIQTLIIITDKAKNKRFVKSRFNDGRWVVCPQDYEEFLDLLKAVSAVKVYQMDKKTLDEQNDGTLYNSNYCNFDILFKFAMEDLASNDWQERRKEYLMRSFIINCDKIMDSKIVVTINCAK